ncbi:FAD-dependent oxidoreductase [Streptomyces sp. NPDC094472]|uniref:FAD-dependent oxidoreductase n=1 Tax=unclassified Streptomyces TaxID=2593676 RepID=UPI003323991F
MYEISDDDVNEGRSQPDTVGKVCFPVDIHDPDTGQAEFFQIGGDGTFDIPYRSLVPAGVDNVIVAGRCISVSSYDHGATYRHITLAMLAHAFLAATTHRARETGAEPVRRPGPSSSQWRRFGDSWQLVVPDPRTSADTEPDVTR